MLMLAITTARTPINICVFNLVQDCDEGKVVAPTTLSSETRKQRAL